jgi:magnesium chelatase family protein
LISTDIHIEVTPVPFRSYLMTEKPKASILEKRVTAAREIQSARFFEEMNNIHYNAQMNTKQIRNTALLMIRSNNY